MVPEDAPLDGEHSQDPEQVKVAEPTSEQLVQLEEPANEADPASHHALTSTQVNHITLRSASMSAREAGC